MIYNNNHTSKSNVVSKFPKMPLRLISDSSDTFAQESCFSKANLAAIEILEVLGVDKPSEQMINDVEVVINPYLDE